MKFLIAITSAIFFQIHSPLTFGNLLPPNVWFGGCRKQTKEYLFSKNTNTSTNFQNECVHRKNNLFICIADDFNDAFFICEANYPIVWEFQVDQRYNVEYTTISNFFKDTYNPATTLYRGILTISKYSWESGSPSTMVTCTSTEFPNLSSSIFTTFNFFPIWRPQKTLHTYVGVESCNKLANPVIFSCPPLGKNGSQVLEKQYSQNEWKPANFSNKQMYYNSNIGFVLNTTLLNAKKLLGEYRCPLKNSSYANFSVIYDISFQSKSIFSGNASVSFRVSYVIPHRPQMEIDCCSGVKGKPPILLAFEYLSKEHCNIRKREILEALDSAMINQNKSDPGSENVTDCKAAVMTGPMYLVVCKGENVDFQETYVNAFHKLSSTTVSKRRKAIFKADGISNFGNKHKALLNRYVPESRMGGLQTQQKVYLTVARRLNKFATADSKFGHSFVIRSFQMFYKNLTNPINLSFSSAKDYTFHKDLLEFERDVFYVGENITIGCIGLLNYYTEGAKMTIKWKNGTFSEIPMQNFVERQGIQILLLRDAIFTSGSMQTIDVLSKPIIVTEDIDSIRCWMPTFGKNQWEKLAKLIKVEKPRFFEKPEEKFEVKAEKDKTILTCTIHEWQPPANISVTWNDKPLQIKWKNANNTVKPEGEKLKDVCVSGDRIAVNGTILIQIVFQKSKADKSGIYRCIAKNENMKVTRNISVTVTDGLN